MICYDINAKDSTSVVSYITVTFTTSLTILTTTMTPTIPSSTAIVTTSSSKVAATAGLAASQEGQQGNANGGGFWGDSSKVAAVSSVGGLALVGTVGALLYQFASRVRRIVPGSRRFAFIHCSIVDRL